MAQKKPEHSFQAQLHRFLERVVLPPREVRGFDVSSAVMANENTRFAMVDRGVKWGSFDHIVAQGSPAVVVGIECKAGKGKASDAQLATAAAYEACGWGAIRECRTMAQALAGLRFANVRLHGNADNLATEYQARADAALVALREKRPTKPRARRQRTSPADLQRGLKVLRRNEWMV